VRKIRVNLHFRIDIRTRRVLQEVYERSTFKTLTDVVEAAILYFAKNKFGIEEKDYCDGMTKFQSTKGEVYCAKKATWVNFVVCLRCKQWKTEKPKTPIEETPREETSEEIEEIEEGETI